MVEIVTFYQFQVDGRPAGHVRIKWRYAAQDAVNAGYATWSRDGCSVHMSDGAGAEIARIESDTWKVTRPG